MNANNGGKVADGNTYIKQFHYGLPNALWKTFSYFNGDETEGINVVTPALENYPNLLISGNLYVEGIIIPSDQYLKDNVKQIDEETTNKIMSLKSSQFILKQDPTRHIHYGFVAQDLEQHYPELVSLKPDIDVANLKSVNYLEIIPLLVSKVQMMQKEIDELKQQINGK